MNESRRNKCSKARGYLRVFLTDLIIRKVLLKLWHSEQILACYPRFSVMHIPKNFTSGIYSTSVFCKKCMVWREALRAGGFQRQRRNDIATVLVIFIKSTFLRNQFSTRFVTEGDLICRASSFLSTTNTFVSSAYRISFVPWMFNGRSLIYIKNKRGPKIEPCGTPYEIALDEDWNLCWVYLLLSVWDISTNCVLFVK